MEITLEKKDKVNAALKINLKEADYRPTYTTKLKEYGKKVQLKGFRPGHVPSTLVEKMYGKSILVDEINNLVSKTITDYLKDNNVEILGDPMPEAKEMATIDWDNQKDFNFTYNLGLAPEFTLDLSDKVAIDAYKITFTDKVLKETVDNLRKQFGIYKDTEVSVEEDIIYAEAKSVVSGRTYKCILPEFRIEEKQRGLFRGVKLNDKISADIRSIVADDASVAYVLGVDKKEAEFINGDFEFVVERISHPELAELNDEFYKKVFRGEEVNSYEDFEVKLKENITKSYEMEGKNSLFNNVFDYYTKNVKIDFPVDFLKEWLYTVNEGKLTKEQIDQQYTDFELSLRWDLIKNKVAKEYNAKVEHEDVMARAKAMVRSQFGMMGGNTLDEEMDKLVTGWAENILKKDNGKEYRKMFDEVFTEKVIETIVSKIKLKEQSVDIEKFKEIQAAKKK